MILIIHIGINRDPRVDTFIEHTASLRVTRCGCFLSPVEIWRKCLIFGQYPKTGEFKNGNTVFSVEHNSISMSFNKKLVTDSDHKNVKTHPQCMSLTEKTEFHFPVFGYCHFLQAVNGSGKGNHSSGHKNHHCACRFLCNLFWLCSFICRKRQCCKRQCAFTSNAKRHMPQDLSCKIETLLL